MKSIVYHQCRWCRLDGSQGSKRSCSPIQVILNTGVKIDVVVDSGYPPETRPRIVGIGSSISIIAVAVVRADVVASRVCLKGVESKCQREEEGELHAAVC